MKTLKDIFIIILFLTVQAYSEELTGSTTENRVTFVGNEETTEANINFSNVQTVENTIPIEIQTTIKTASTTVGTTVAVETNTVSESIEPNSNIDTLSINNKSMNEPNLNSEDVKNENTDPSDAIELPEIIIGSGEETSKGETVPPLQTSPQETTENILGTSEIIEIETSTKETDVVENGSGESTTISSTTLKENTNIPLGENNFEDKIATETPIPECTTVGNFSYKGNCRTYYSCKGGPIEFIQERFECDENSAFNEQIGQCLRDISSCGVSPKCSIPGILADPESRNFYYVCLAGRMNGYQKYHIKCDRNKMFSPLLGECFTDLTNLQSSDTNMDDNSLSDLEIVKNDIKIIDDAQKVIMKTEEDKIKLEKKLKKKQDKMASKQQKRLQKLAEQNLKQNSGIQNQFVCSSEGSFPIPNEKSLYYSCVLQKLIMACPLGQEFNEQSGKCLDLTTQST